MASVPAKTVIFAYLICSQPDLIIWGSPIDGEIKKKDAILIDF